MSFQATCFVFTINNYTQEDIDSCRSAIENNWGCNYICFGFEIGPECGTPHIQGYLQTDHRMRCSTVNRNLGNRARLARARGSLEQNEVYTSKETEWESYGIPRTAKRERSKESFTDLICALEAGGSARELALRFPELHVKHYSNISKLREVFGSDRSFSAFYGPFPWATPAGFEAFCDWRRCLWLCGPSGIGKTQFACSLIERPLFVRHVDQLKNFNALDYGGIIFDDMSFTHWPRESQITLLDCDMPTAIHIRYKVVELPALTKRVFTSNVVIFADDPAIARRYHRVNFN